MEPIDARDFTNSLTYLFKETFEGSPKEGSIYLDKGVGVFNTIEGISAKDASNSIAGANIAAHTEHLRYYLEVLSNFLQGTVQVADWNRSWSIDKVTDDEWQATKNNLQIEYKAVLDLFKNHTNWNQDTITEATAIVVHTAYHLGSIRQIIKGQK